MSQCNWSNGAANETVSTDVDDMMITGYGGMAAREWIGETEIYVLCCILR
jgi:hypothetical protein